MIFLYENAFAVNGKTICIIILLKSHHRVSLTNLKICVDNLHSSFFGVMCIMEYLIEAINAHCTEHSVRLRVINIFNQRNQARIVRSIRQTTLSQIISIINSGFI